MYLISKKYQRKFYIYYGMFWMELSTCNLVQECTFALFKLMLWYSLWSRRRRRRRPFYTTYTLYVQFYKPSIVTTWWFKKGGFFQKHKNIFRSNYVSICTHSFTNLVSLLQNLERWLFWWLERWYKSWNWSRRKNKVMLSK